MMLDVKSKCVILQNEITFEIINLYILTRMRTSEQGLKNTSEAKKAVMQEKRIKNRKIGEKYVKKSDK